VVEHLRRKPEALSSILSIAKKKKKKVNGWIQVTDVTSKSHQG
jgi:hypothetical protein